MKYHPKEEMQPLGEENYYATVSHSLAVTSPSNDLDFYDQIVKKDKRGCCDNATYASLQSVASVQSALQDTHSNSGNQKVVTPEAAEDSKVCLDDVIQYTTCPSTSCHEAAMPSVPIKSDFVAIQDCETEIKKTGQTDTPVLKNRSKVLVRPIAFKPVIPRKRNDGSPERSSFTPISYDDGYSSQGTSRGCSNSVSTMSRESDTFYASPIHTSSYQPEFQVIPIQHEQSMTSDNVDYESLLQDKESEISKLRRTMELNESAIVRVHEQKRIEWENQMKELTKEYHRRLRIQQDQTKEREAELRETIAKLEIDNRQLMVDIQQNAVDKDRQHQLVAQLHELKQRHSDTSHRLTQESCDSDILRHKNKELENKTRKLQDQLSLGSAEQERLKERLAKLGGNQPDKTIIQPAKIKQLNELLEQQEKQIQQERETFKSEMKNWHDEKEKVLQYQKQLQRTYVQMYRRNNELEQQLCRINARRQAKRESQQHSINNIDRYSLLSVDLETTPESFC